jgi:hypothetical protein
LEVPRGHRGLVTTPLDFEDNIFSLNHRDAKRRAFRGNFSFKDGKKKGMW